jgi:hypothetical protein
MIMHSQTGFNTIHFTNSFDNWGDLSFAFLTNVGHFLFRFVYCTNIILNIGLFVNQNNTCETFPAGTHCMLPELQDPALVLLLFVAKNSVRLH